jgi:hypothetical protein
MATCEGLHRRRELRLETASEPRMATIRPLFAHCNALQYAVS